MSILCRKNYIVIVFTAIILLFFNQLLSAKAESYLLDAITHSALTEIHEDMRSGKNNAALKKLNQLALSDKIKDYDAAVVYQTMGFAENNLNNFKNATEYFIKALSFNALPGKVTHELLYSIAQLLIHIEKPKEGLTYLSKWFANESKPKADAYILAATAYYYTQNYKQLIVHAEKALSLNINPPLNWYELLLAGYFEIKDYKNAAITLENIIAKYPEKMNYWLQLANIYQHLGKEKKALAMYELAYTKKLLKKNEIIQLIESYLYLKMPFKAATLLEKEMVIGNIKTNKERLLLLVDSWILAKEYEKAKSVFNEIIKKFNDDTARLRLGQLYIDSEEWKKAIEVLNIKLQSDDRTLIAKVNFLLGIAQYHSNNLSNATRAFTNSLSDPATEEQAKWYLEHLKKTSEKIKES